MNEIQTLSVNGRIVSENPATARLFMQHDIDFCCHGEVALGDACTARGIDADDFLARVRAIARASPPDGVASLTEADARAIAQIVSRRHGTRSER